MPPETKEAAKNMSGSLAVGVHSQNTVKRPAWKMEGNTATKMQRVMDYDTWGLQYKTSRITGKEIITEREKNYKSIFSVNISP